MRQRISVFCAVLMAIALTAPSVAKAQTVLHSVGPQENLYFSDWGHPYQAVGTGAPARVVQLDGRPLNFAQVLFPAGTSELQVTATGCVVSYGPVCVGTAGTPLDNYIFRGLMVYGLIGLWASDTGPLGPIGVIGNPFLLGASSIVTVPNAPNAFLYFGVNDGLFADNTSGSFEVTLSGFRLTTVPEPSSVALLAAGLLGLGMVARKRRRMA
jgi:hypothetical protein